MNIPIDEKAWRDAGFVFVRRGDVYRFMIDGRTDICEVKAADGSLVVFEERSSAHRALVDAMGISR